MNTIYSVWEGTYLPWPFCSFTSRNDLNHCFHAASCCCSSHERKELSNKQKKFTYSSWYFTGINRKLATWTIGHIPPSSIKAGRKSLFTSSLTWSTLFPVENPMYVKNTSKSNGPNMIPSSATFVATNRIDFGGSWSRNLISRSNPSYLQEQLKSFSYCIQPLFLETFQITDTKLTTSPSQQHA